MAVSPLLRSLVRRLTSKMALRIYAIGLFQFLIVIVVLEIDHRREDSARRAQMAEYMRETRGGTHGVSPTNHDAPPPPPPPHDGPGHDHDGPHAGPGHDGPPPFGGPGERPPPPRGGGPGGPGHHPPPGPPLGFATIVILIVVGVSSWLMARSFAHPLKQLTLATRAFGKGDLHARARMDRDDEIGEVAKAFDDMADRIAALLLAERELLANVSHELRTPLARIRVALDLASEADTTTNPQAALESFAEIAQDLAELERIVDDVLASARLALDTGAKAGSNQNTTTQSLPLRAEQIDMHALLDKSVARFRAAHPDRELIVDVPNNKDDERRQLPMLNADPVLLRRVIDNLLDNAQKYAEDPHGNKAAHTPIHLRAREEDRKRKGDDDNTAAVVVIEIVDHGIGISKEDQARLFEPFFRADRSRTRTTGGLGLGLVLARRVVEAHGGTLTIESDLGKGTTARVRLPLTPTTTAQR